MTGVGGRVTLAAGDIRKQRGGESSRASAGASEYGLGLHFIKGWNTIPISEGRIYLWCRNVRLLVREWATTASTAERTMAMVEFFTTATRNREESGGIRSVVGQ